MLSHLKRKHSEVISVTSSHQNDSVESSASAENMMTFSNKKKQMKHLH